MIPVAVQLYSVRDKTANDFLGTLKKVAEIGYSGVEFAGFGNVKAEELKAELDKLGLKAVSSHVAIEMLEKDLDSIIQYHKTIGCSYIVCPFSAPDRRNTKEKCVEFAKKLDEIGAKLKEHGITFGYHNHNFEFEKFDDEYILDIFFANSSPENVIVELDTFWVTAAGVDPVAYIKKYGKRCRLVHLKDMAPNAHEIFEQFKKGEKPSNSPFAEVGYGTMDIKAIIQASEEVGADWFIVEQDMSNRDTLESITMSYNYLKSIGKA